MSLPRSFALSRNKTEHPRGWETKNPSRSPFLCSPEITKMRKIIYYGISSDAPSFGRLGHPMYTGAAGSYPIGFKG